MIYPNTVQQPKHDWYMQTGKDSLVNDRKIYEKFGRTIYLLWPQFHSITGCDMISYFFNLYKRILFWQASSFILILLLDLLILLDLLNIITEAVNNEVTNLSKSMFTVLRKWKGLLRLEWDNTMN